MNKVKSGDRESAAAYVYGSEYKDAITQINTLKEQFLSVLDTRTAEQVSLLKQKIETIRLQMIFALSIVGIMQLCNMILVRFKILRPVMRVKRQMQAISQGNLSASFDLTPDTSEIGMLVDSIHEPKRELKKYISNINRTLTQMAQGNLNLSIGMIIVVNFNQFSAQWHKFLIPSIMHCIKLIEPPNMY